MGRSERRRIVAVVGALATVAVACNAIVGLSDYEYAPCNGGACADADALDASGDAHRPAPPVVSDASGARPVRWAHFKMPNYAQDGGPTDNVQSSETYEATAGGYRDTITDLVWRADDAVDQSWQEAEQICAALSEGGRWRVPSRIELVTLLDLSRSSKKIDVTFTNGGKTRGSQYWTASEVRPAVGDHRLRWTVDFENGGLDQRDETSKAAVRCIKDLP